MTINRLEQIKAELAFITIYKAEHKKHTERNYAHFICNGIERYETRLQQTGYSFFQAKMLLSDIREKVKDLVRGYITLESRFLSEGKYANHNEACLHTNQFRLDWLTNHAKTLRKEKKALLAEAKTMEALL
jgi:hypothetical protein